MCDFDVERQNLGQKNEQLTQELAAARRMSRCWKELARRWHYIATGWQPDEDLLPRLDEP